MCFLTEILLLWPSYERFRGTLMSAVFCRIAYKHIYIDMGGVGVLSGSQEVKTCTTQPKCSRLNGKSVKKNIYSIYIKSDTDTNTYTTMALWLRSSYSPVSHSDFSSWLCKKVRKRNSVWLHCSVTILRNTKAIVALNRRKRFLNVCDFLPEVWDWLGWACR